MDPLGIYPKLQDFPIRGKRVFVRVDFNVPLAVNAENAWEVKDATRLIAACETIRYIQKQGARCLLASHLGRPKGKPELKYSLEPVGLKLSEILGVDVVLTPDFSGDGLRGLVQRMSSDELLLLENLRFHPGEEANAPDFAMKLAQLCDIFINDAFGTMHRAHASTAALPGLVKAKAIGFLVQRELEYLTPLRDNPKRPFVLLMGGAKVSDKLNLIERLLPKVEAILIGGAMAYAFLKAKGNTIGNSLCDDAQVELAGRLLETARSRSVSVELPCDHVVTRSLDSKMVGEATLDENIPDGMIGVDIGPKTIRRFEAQLARAQTIFWNGPMGIFEREAFAKGTYELARLVASVTGKKLAGGGDVAAAIAGSGVQDGFDFISTGGGATLEFLEGKVLPGLKALEFLRHPG